MKAYRVSHPLEGGGYSSARRDDVNGEEKQKVENFLSTQNIRRPDGVDRDGEEKSTVEKFSSTLRERRPVGLDWDREEK